MTYDAILTLDPGLRSGIAEWYPGQGGPPTFRAFITDPWDTMIHLEQWSNRHAGQNVLIVSESFHINMDTPKKDQTHMHWPWELRGVARYLAGRCDIDFESQRPSEGKDFGTDAKLRRWGFWTPGTEDHARDAGRHMLLALARHKMLYQP